MRTPLFLALLFISANLACNTVDSRAEAAPPSSRIEDKAAKDNAAVSAVEDLMREHSLLGRLLLIYEEIIRRIENNEPFPSESLMESTEITRNFIQDYHEKLEEKYLFPRFRKAERFVWLVDTLRQQHEAGRRLIDEIMKLQRSVNTQDKKRLSQQMRSFIHMYRPHKAWEDTVLFPAFHSIVGPQEYNELGEEFEEQEHRLLGEGGFKRTVARVGQIEKSLGIYKLSQFTPAGGPLK